MKGDRIIPEKFRGEQRVRDVVREVEIYQWYYKVLSLRRGNSTFRGVSGWNLKVQQFYLILKRVKHDRAKIF